MVSLLLRLLLFVCLPLNLCRAQTAQPIATGLELTSNTPPTAAFTADCDGLRCQLNAGASTDPDGTIVHYQWMIGNSALSTAMDFRYAFTKPGRYRIELTVTDHQRQKATQSRDIVVSDPTVYPLPPNQQLSKLHGVQGQVLSYRLNTTKPQQRVTITAHGGRGPLQLAARLTRPPSQQHADCRQQRRQQPVSCQLVLTKPGTVYLQLQGLADFQDVTLQAYLEPAALLSASGLTATQGAHQSAVTHQHLQYDR